MPSISTILTYLFYVSDSWGVHSMGAGWWVLMVLFWAAVIAGVVWLVRWVATGGEIRETPGEILDRRLADGALTPEEYEARRSVLNEDASARAERERLTGA